MKLLNVVFTGLMWCNVFWAVSYGSEVNVPPVPSPSSGCNSMISFSSDAPSSEGNKDINLRSLSPWIWRPITDENQIPSTLWEAECKSTFCSSHNHQHQDGLSLNSVPIYENLLILKRNNSKLCYTATYRSVAVGCTCVRAKTVQN